MLWFFIALQAMTPFIHAHAGSVQLNHGGFLHMHEGAHADAPYHVVAGAEHGAEVEVAQGMPSRPDTESVAHAEALWAPVIPALAASASRPGAGLPAPPLLYLSPPDHTLPLALAPPRR